MPSNADTEVTWETYARAEGFLPWNAYKLVYNVQVQPNWIKAGDGGPGNRFWYLNRTRGGKEFVLVDPERGTRAPAFDHVRLAAALSLASGTPYEHTDLPFSGFEFAEEGHAIQFDVEETRCSCDLDTYRCAQGAYQAPPAPGELVSPDGRWAAFLKGDDLYVRDLETGEEIRLTDDAEPYYNYASSPDSSTNPIVRRLSGEPQPPVALWSPDSKRLLTHRLDQRKVKEIHLLQSVPGDGRVRPVVHAYRYPLPGDENVALAELVIFDLEADTRVDVDYEAHMVFFVSPIEAQRVWWSDDGQRVYFLYMERGDKAMRLCEVDAGTGAVRTIIEEKGRTYVEANLVGRKPPNVRVLDDGSEIIWFSQRDGWAHLYLYDGGDGGLKHQITSGPWVVRELVHVDEAERWIYFTAAGREAGRDPYYRHLYRIGLDGEGRDTAHRKGLELLTPEDADHEVKFSPRGDCFVDTYARMDAAPVTVLRTCDGALACELEQGDVERLLATGWSWPERFCVKARDGVTDLYGIIYRPSNFDPGQRYPVLDAIYPGPQTIMTPTAFPQDMFSAYWFWEPQAMAELGFIVVTIDGLGTPLRSKAFHDLSYGKLEEAGGLEDHITGLRQLASQRPYMDLSRVGIYGHSGGGFASARAILAYPDFYKVAVSSAGNHDQRGYLAGWGEKHHGFLESGADGADNYQSQVTANLAANLQGKLLLACGDMDDNVHPALTMQLVDALIKANKDFDLLILPNRHHLFKLDPYFTRKRWDYFVAHLLGTTPPEGYKIQDPGPAFAAAFAKGKW